MRALKNRRGTTLLELVVVVGLLSMALLATMSLLSTSLKMWSQGSSGTSSNMYAGLAARRLAKEIEEGRSAAIVNGKLAVTFAYQVSAGSDYDTSKTGAVWTYYLSGSTGNEASGASLWKSSTSGKVRLGKNIDSLTFSVVSGKLVRFTLVGRDDVGGAIRPNMVQQSVKLRNS